VVVYYGPWMLSAATIGHMDWSTKCWGVLKPADGVSLAGLSINAVGVLWLLHFDIESNDACSRIVKWIADTVE
jgi:hypothetical protein